MKVTKMVRKPRDSERALYVEGSLGNASNSARGVDTISSSLSSSDGDCDRSKAAMAGRVKRSVDVEQSV